MRGGLALLYVWSRFSELILAVGDGSLTWFTHLVGYPIMLNR